MKFLTIQDDEQIDSISVSFLKRNFECISTSRNRVVIFTKNEKEQSKYGYTYSSEEAAKEAFLDIKEKINLIID